MHFSIQAWFGTRIRQRDGSLAILWIIYKLFLIHDIMKLSDDMVVKLFWNNISYQILTRVKFWFSQKSQKLSMFFFKFPICCQHCCHMLGTLTLHPKYVTHAVPLLCSLAYINKCAKQINGIKLCENEYLPTYQTNTAVTSTFTKHAYLTVHTFLKTLINKEVRLKLKKIPTHDFLKHLLKTVFVLMMCLCLWLVRWGNKIESNFSVAINTVCLHLTCKINTENLHTEL